MSLGSQYRRVLGLIAALTTAGGLTADLRTLAARCDTDESELGSLLRALIVNGLVVQVKADPTAGRPVAEYRLSMAGWDAVDDLAAVDPRSDLDIKQREYSRAAAAVAQFGEGSGTRAPAGSFADAVANVELAKHRYDRALARYDERARRPVGSVQT